MVINVKNSIRRMTVLNVQTMPGDNYRPKNRIMYIIKIFSNKSNGTKKFYRQNRRHFVAQVDRKWPVEEPKLYRCKDYWIISVSYFFRIPLMFAPVCEQVDSCSIFAVAFQMERCPCASNSSGCPSKDRYRDFPSYEGHYLGIWTLPFSC